MASNNLSGKPRLLLVGGGRVGRELLQRSLPYWRVVLVDKSAEVLEQIRKSVNKVDTEAEACRLFQGDATSSIALEEADIEDADAVVVTTPDDRVNAEVCRIAVERYKKAKVVSLVNQEDARDLFPAASVEFIHRNQHLASLLENKLHHGSAQSVPYGTGEGQIIEAEVMALLMKDNVVERKRG